MQVDDESSPIAEVGGNIRRLRTERGLTAVQLARSAGISQSFVSELEAGNRSPSLSTLFALADILQTTPAALLRTEEEHGTRVVRSDQVPDLRVTEESDAIQMQALAQIGAVSVFQLEGTGQDDIRGIFQHEGEEFVYIVEGALEVTVEGSEPVILQVGDSVSYDASRPHSWDIHQDQPFTAIQVLVKTTPK